MQFRLIRALGCAAALAFTAQAGAQSAPATTDWPQHPVRIVVPFQAGSATDLISRQLGAALSTELGQPFVVEARPAPPPRSAARRWRVRPPTATRC